MEELIKRIEALEAEVAKIKASVFPAPDLSHFGDEGHKADDK